MRRWKGTRYGARVGWFGEARRELIRSGGLVRLGADSDEDVASV